MAKPKDIKLKIGFWHAARDIFVTSINKGQFPLALLGAILLLMVFKMPWEAIRDLLHGFMDKLERGSLAGWILWLLTSLGWVYVSKRSRKTHITEVRRVAKEKSVLHQELLGQDAPSSES